MQGLLASQDQLAAAPVWNTAADCPLCLQWRDWGWQQRLASQLAREHARSCQRAQAEAEGRWREERDKRRVLERQVAGLQREKDDLQRDNAALLKKPFGFSSEKRPPDKDAPPSPGGGPSADSGGEAGSPPKKRKRGGQPGARSHKRVQREGLPVRKEVLQPPPAACVCAQCGKAFRRNGETVSKRVEIRVKAHIRHIRRPRYRAVCRCAQQRGLAVPEAQAELEPTLFRGSNYGRSVYVEFLLAVYWHRHPARAFEREWLDHGVQLPASTLLGRIADYLRWFAPLEKAIAVHQQREGLAHGDETTWPVHVRAEEGHKARCWLWVCVTPDAVRMIVDPTRSTQAAERIFGELGRHGTIVLVCDRYCVYKRLASAQEGCFVVAYCWAHVRRDYLSLGRKRSQLREWADDVVDRIGQLYRINRSRLALWDPQRPLAEQGADFQAQQERLQTALAGLFEHAEKERERLTPKGQSETARWLTPPDPRLKPLRSLLGHREGLEVFLQRPEVPLDNNSAERALRRPVVGRKLSYGSHSQAGANLQAMLLSVFGTLAMGGIDLKGWLDRFLARCAQLDRDEAPDPAGWLPWDMPPERREALQAGPAREPGPAP